MKGGAEGRLAASCRYYGLAPEPGASQGGAGASLRHEPNGANS